MANPANSTDTLDLCFDMLQTLEDARTEIPNLKQLSNDWFLQLLRYTTFEVCAVRFVLKNDAIYLTYA